MKLTLSPSVAIELETIANQTRGHEFSGIGKLSVNGNGMVVEDIVMLDVGSGALTEINPNDLYEVSQMEGDWRVWFHRHPIGNGIPGRHNWSGTDEDTISSSPLGGIPQIIKWSVSIVRTPKGWVGRIDNHVTGKTAHLPVEGQAPKRAFVQSERLLRAYEVKEYKQQTEWRRRKPKPKKKRDWGKIFQKKAEVLVTDISKEPIHFPELATCSEDYIDEDWYDYLYNLSVDVSVKLGYDLIPEDFSISETGEIALQETGLVVEYMPFEFLDGFDNWCDDMRATEYTESTSWLPSWDGVKEIFQ